MRSRVFAHGRGDAWLLVATAVHLLLVVAALGGAAGGVVGRCGLILALALAVAWTSNTVSHIHLHTPLFVSARANAAFSLLLGALLGVPQSWWRRRHLAHHGLLGEHELAGARSRGAGELAFLAAAWSVLLVLSPARFVAIFLPAFVVGLGFCAIQGHEEHAGAAEGVDVRGAFYNALWFNDGFHSAHHRAPEAHWSSLPTLGRDGDPQSKLPPLLRWLERSPALMNRLSARCLDLLERACLGWPSVLRLVRARHAEAWRRVLRDVEVETVQVVRIVGGGLFPRSALILADLFPDARLEIQEREVAHVRLAAEVLARTGTRLGEGRLSCVIASFEAGQRVPGIDLLVIPLAFRGERRRLYERPPARFVVVHDWIWRRPRGVKSAVVAWWLLKRLNLVDGRDLV